MVFGYVFFVFFFAKQQASSARYTNALLARWLPNLAPAQIGRLVFLTRKAVHVFAYGGLTLIVHYAARRTKITRAQALPFAVMFALVVAVLDESYQMRLPHRTGTSADVYIDGIGIAAAAWGIWLGGRLRKKDREVKEDVEE